MPLAASIAFPLDSASGGLSSWGHHRCMREAFWRMSLVGRDKSWDSDLNESTRLWWRFSYAIDRMVDLTLQVEGKVYLM